MKIPKARNVAITVLLIAALGGLGLAIAQDQETLRIRSSIPVEDRRFPDYLADLVGHSLTTGDSYIVHTNGNVAFPAMLAAIEQARERVSLESYIYDKGAVGGRFAAALAKAARRGVQVRLVLDSIGSKSMAEEDKKQIEDAGGRIAWMNPLAGYAIEEVNRRTHRKALVIDGTVAFVGGMGFADQWERDTEDFKQWRDTQLELRGPVVTNVEAGFNQNWILTGGVVDPQVKPETKARPGESRSLVVWSSPQGGANEMKLLYLLSIAGARRTLDIQSPYLITDESSQWSLQEARRRGVRVRLLVEGEATDAMAVKYASRADYQHLLEMGVEIAEYQPAMMHTKATIVDGVLSIVGSANFDNRSLELNDELNVAVFDPELAKRLGADLEKDWARSKQLTLEEWSKRPAQEKAREWLWSYFGEIF